MKIPHHEVLVALGRPEALVAGCSDLEQDLAVEQQRNQLVSKSAAEKAILPPQLADLVRRRQRGERGRYPGIGDTQQRAGARRFQHHVAAAPAQIGEPGQDDGVGRAELRRLRPVVGCLRFDDDDIVIAANVGEAVFEESLPGEPPHQKINLTVDRTALGRKRMKRQAGTKVSRAFECARAEFAQFDRIAIENSSKTAVGARLKRESLVQAGGKNAWRDLSRLLWFERAHAAVSLRYEGGMASFLLPA